MTCNLRHRIHPFLRLLLGLALGAVVLGAAVPLARANEPLSLRFSWEGPIDYFATGAPMAADGPDSGTNVDMLAQPATVTVTANDVPATATLLAAYVYWGGTIPDHADCSDPLLLDREVTVSVPGSAVFVPTPADDCYCVAGASGYDIQACRADITTLVAVSGMIGAFSVDEFAAQVANGSTDNASFSLVLVYEEPDLLPPRRVALYDGAEEMYQSTKTYTLSGIDVDSPARGDLTWYVLEGDVSGGVTQNESVTVTGQPTGNSLALSDAINPATDVMNRTINTTSPVQTGVVGVDIDRFDISGALDPADTSVEMTYAAGSDKFWVVYNLVGVNIYAAVIHPKASNKTWSVRTDADGSGTITPGDTIRYTIHLENVGTAPGEVDVTDPIPLQVASWTPVSLGGGTDQSTVDSFVVTGVPMSAGGSVDLVFDVVIAAGTEGESMINVAAYDSGPNGTQGVLPAPPVIIGATGVPDAGPVDAAVQNDAAIQNDAAVQNDVAVQGDAVVQGDAAIQRDAAVHSDAGGDDAEPVGCGCAATGGDGAGMFLLLGLLGWIWTRRRRRD
jgi:MYXO-CTERM domain-containing protein/uncharacterized repeat protein (TIGR01451 family)